MLSVMQLRHWQQLPLWLPDNTKVASSFSARAGIQKIKAEPVHLKFLGLQSVSSGIALRVKVW